MEDEASTINRAVGDTVRHALRDAGSSVRLAAERAGLNYRSVRRYIAGERDMPVPVLLALVHASGVDLTELTSRLLKATSPSTESSTAEVAFEKSTGETTDSGPATGRNALESRLRRLGVTRLAARSIGPIDAAEIDVVLDLVEQIVLDTRANLTPTSPQTRP